MRELSGPFLFAAGLVLIYLAADTPLVLLGIAALAVGLWQIIFRRR